MTSTTTPSARSLFADHTRGRSDFVDDLPLPAGCLVAAVVTSPLAHAHLGAIDTAAARAVDGVVAVFTAADVPGANQIGGIILDEPLLADGAVHFRGQPVALVVATDDRAARAGAAAVTVALEELPGIFDPREAAARGELIAPSRTMSLGDVDSAFSAAATVVSGRVESAGQEHLYLETQGAVATPLEGRRLRLQSATQAPTVVQRIVARVLGLPMSAIEVEVGRLGGAFGGKEDQATAWAALAGLGAHLLGRPVKLVLDRHDDLRCTGKRHPYSSDFRLGLDADGRFVAYEVTFFQNAGAAADLSTAILERSMFHATGAYFIPNVRITAHSCRTNLVPFTAFRGFGAPQAMFVLEAAITRAAEVMGGDRLAIQRANLLSDGDPLPCGMRVENPQARRSFAVAEERFRVAELKAEVVRHNAADPIMKRGLALMPVCFGISFTNTFLNQAAALVHVYTDGSVTVSTGAVEMGQGVNAKIRAVAAATLGLPAERITVTRTSTTTVANSSPTAASSGADMNGAATQLACRQLADRLVRVAADHLACPPAELALAGGQVLRHGEATGLGWDELVWRAYTSRVSLSAQAHYATPRIHFDRATMQGQPFAYHVFGTAVVEVTVDCLRGRSRVDRVQAVHDGGVSLDPLVDSGQLEGGLVQGLGWMTCEDLVFDGGILRSDSLSTYKVPDIHFAPVIESVFLGDVGEPAAVLSSKAIGEPPFMYGIGAWFAILDAVRAVHPERPVELAAPMTPERILTFLYGPEPE